MKKKEKSRYQDASIAELKKLAGETEAGLSVLSVKRYTEQQKNTRVGKIMREKLAVLKTVVRLKELRGGNL